LSVKTEPQVFKTHIDNLRHMKFKVLYGEGKCFPIAGEKLTDLILSEFRSVLKRKLNAILN